LRASTRCFWLLLIAGTLAALTPGEVSAEGAIGVFGGLIRSNLSGDTPDRFKYETKLGGSAGAVGEFNVTDDVRLSFQPMFLQRGATLTVKLPGESTRRDSLDLRMNYVALPILVKIISGNGKTYVTGGLSLGYLLSAELSDSSREKDIKDDLNTIDLSADIGFGIMLPIGKPLLTMELRYEQGLTNTADRAASLEEEVVPVRFRASSFQLFAGLMLPLGGR
jgi:hypothetical protein